MIDMTSGPRPVPGLETGRETETTRPRPETAVPTARLNYMVEETGPGNRWHTIETGETDPLPARQETVDVVAETIAGNRSAETAARRVSVWTGDLCATTIALPSRPPADRRPRPPRPVGDRITAALRSPTGSTPRGSRRAWQRVA